MKVCSTCNRAYSDDAQQFCLDDGTPLVAGQASGNADPFVTPHSPQLPNSKKRKIWVWALAGLAVLVVLGLVVVGAAGVFLYTLYDGKSNRTGSNTAGTTLYVNSRDKFTGALAENYVDFSFRYPNTWEVHSEPTPSFVRVERNNSDGNMIESFSVGWFASPGSAVGNTELLSQVTNNVGNQLARNVPTYVKVAEGNTTIGRYKGYELRFVGTAAKYTPREVRLWGRIVVIPDFDGGKNGVLLILVASGHSSEVKGQPDLGEKGELPIILSTFKLGV